MHQLKDWHGRICMVRNAICMECNAMITKTIMSSHRKIYTRQHASLRRILFSTSNETEIFPIFIIININTKFNRGKVEETRSGKTREPVEKDLRIARAEQILQGNPRHSFMGYTSKMPLS